MNLECDCKAGDAAMFHIELQCIQINHHEMKMVLLQVVAANDKPLLMTHRQVKDIVLGN